MHWNCTQGTLGIRQIAPLQSPPPPTNKEAKIRGHCAAEIITVHIIYLDILAL